MNNEEIQRTIEGMLSVQLELQKSQIEFKIQFQESLTELRTDIAELRAGITDLKEISQRHERRIDQLIGYSITQESDRLDLLQRLRNLERRVNRLELNDNGNREDS